ncbi:MAG: hypothetical protein QXK47_05200 [Candidatus Bathyarchaeia archaeon]
MEDLVRKALIKKVQHGKTTITLKPSETLVLLVKFSVAATILLTGLEIVHVLILGKWNSEVFAAISGLIGTVSGIFISQKT